MDRPLRFLDGGAAGTLSRQIAAVHPELFRVGRHAVETDGALYFVATVVAAVYMARVFRSRRWNPDDILPGLILTVIAAYVGAKLHGAMSPWYRFAADPLGEVLQPGDLSFFGGMFLGALAAIGYIRWRRYPLGEATDALAPVGPVLYAIFRLGCLMNGDDYGRPTDLPWGMRFPEGSPPTTTPVHPTQIYEMAAMAPVFGWLWTRRNRGLPPGALAWELAILMGVERFVVEFWRRGAPGLAGLTPSQWLAILLIVIGIAGRFRLRRGDRLARAARR